MKLILCLVFCLLGSVLAIPSQRIRRDVSHLGDARYSTDYHHHHHHDHNHGNGDGFAIGRSIGGYAPSYGPPASVYGPPNHVPGTPVSSDHYSSVTAAPQPQHEYVPAQPIHVPEPHHQIQEQHYHQVQQSSNTYLGPVQVPQQHNNQPQAQAPREHFTSVTSPSYSIPLDNINDHTHHDDYVTPVSDVHQEPINDHVQTYTTRPPSAAVPLVIPPSTAYGIPDLEYIRPAQTVYVQSIPEKEPVREPAPQAPAPVPHIPNYQFQSFANTRPKQVLSSTLNTLGQGYQNFVSHVGNTLSSVFQEFRPQVSNSFRVQQPYQRPVNTETNIQAGRNVYQQPSQALASNGGYIY